MSTLLAIDVGNTNIKVGIFQEEKLCHFWRISTLRNQTLHDIQNRVEGLLAENKIMREEITGIVMSSVVPSLTPVLESMCEEYFRLSPLVIGPGMKTGLQIQYENPRELGSDRVCNAVAAIHHYGAPLIVVGLGTATTFCVIDEREIYLGGLILPGIQISTEALFQHASQLPRIELLKPVPLIGHDTAESMQSGAIYGGAGQIDGIVQRIFEEKPLPYKVIATGGLSQLVAPHSMSVTEINPNLLFEGLLILWELNQ